MNCKCVLGSQYSLRQIKTLNFNDDSIRRYICKGQSKRQQNSGIEIYYENDKAFNLNPTDAISRVKGPKVGQTLTKLYSW